VLVWLGEVGMEALEREREVLSRELVQAAMTAVTSAERAALLGGMREKSTLAFMAKMPAWKDHPRVRGS
jgi:hypothetical protein